MWVRGRLCHKSWTCAQHANNFRFNPSQTQLNLEWIVSRSSKIARYELPEEIKLQHLLSPSHSVSSPMSFPKGKLPTSKLEISESSSSPVRPHSWAHDRPNAGCGWLEAQARGVQFAAHPTWYALCQYPLQFAMAYATWQEACLGQAFRKNACLTWRRALQSFPPAS